MCPGRESNRRPSGLQAGARSAEPLQPGPSAALHGDGARTRCIGRPSPGRPSRPLSEPQRRPWRLRAAPARDAPGCGFGPGGGAASGARRVWAEGRGRAPQTLGEHGCPTLERGAVLWNEAPRPGPGPSPALALSGRFGRQGRSVPGGGLRGRAPLCSFWGQGLFCAAGPPCQGAPARHGASLTLGAASRHRPETTQRPLCVSGLGLGGVPPFRRPSLHPGVGRRCRAPAWKPGGREVISPGSWVGGWLVAFGPVLAAAPGLGWDAAACWRRESRLGGGPPVRGVGQGAALRPRLRPRLPTDGARVALRTAPALRANLQAHTGSGRTLPRARRCHPRCSSFSRCAEGRRGRGRWPSHPGPSAATPRGRGSRSLFLGPGLHRMNSHGKWLFLKGQGPETPRGRVTSKSCPRGPAGMAHARWPGVLAPCTPPPCSLPALPPPPQAPCVWRACIPRAADAGPAATLRHGGWRPALPGLRVLALGACSSPPPAGFLQGLGSHLEGPPVSRQQPAGRCFPQPVATRRPTLRGRRCKSPVWRGVSGGR